MKPYSPALIALVDLDMSVVELKREATCQTPKDPKIYALLQFAEEAQQAGIDSTELLQPLIHTAVHKPDEDTQLAIIREALDKEQMCIFQFALRQVITRAYKEPPSEQILETISAIWFIVVWFASHKKQTNVLDFLQQNLPYPIYKSADPTPAYVGR